MLAAAAAAARAVMACRPCRAAGKTVRRSLLGASQFTHQTRDEVGRLRSNACVTTPGKKPSLSSLVSEAVSAAHVAALNRCTSSTINHSTSDTHREGGHALEQGGREGALGTGRN